jgi:Carboxypeptidase regulatory-like domain
MRFDSIRKRRTLLEISAVAVLLSLLDSGALRPEAGFAGTVIDWRTGKPVAGVRVSPSYSIPPVATNEKGEFQFTGLEPNTYTVRAEKIGYARAETFIKIRVGNPKAPIQIAIHPESTIAGCLTTLGIAAWDHVVSFRREQTLAYRDFELGKGRMSAFGEVLLKAAGGFR